MIIFVTMAYNPQVFYSFVTHWQTQAPLASVWEAIYKSEEWPQWWKSVVAVKEIKKGDERGIGSIRAYTLRSPMLYKLSFNLLLTDRVDYKLLSGKASGELEGEGVWHFRQTDGLTHIQCHWDVHTNVTWMNRFAFLLKPIFRYNHKLLMNRGAKSLAQKLNVAVAVVK